MPRLIESQRGSRLYSQTPSSAGTFRVTLPVHGADPEGHSEAVFLLLEPRRVSISPLVEGKQTTTTKKLAQQLLFQDQLCPGPQLLT